MQVNGFKDVAAQHLRFLCEVIDNRRVGSEGNRSATDYFATKMAALGFDVSTPGFNCIDWRVEDVTLRVGSQAFSVYGSPYSLGCDLQAPLVMASTSAALEALNAEGCILLLNGELTREQLMPKHFPFYNPEHHRKIIALLETKAPRAIITATGRNPGLAGALHPFPLIEDGDFDIPSVYMTEEEGQKLAGLEGQMARLVLQAERIPTMGCNVIAQRGAQGSARLLLCAHIDAKRGTPGAIDNAAGVTVLLLLAHMLADDDKRLGIEIVALNGEDYYAAPGQILYLQQNKQLVDDFLVAVNLDGPGYIKGRSAYSSYACPDWMEQAMHETFARYPGISEGPPWYQSDHSIFIQRGLPAIAITSEHFQQLSAQITHTEADVPALVDPGRLVEVAEALRDLYRALSLELRIGDA